MYYWVGLNVLCQQHARTDDGEEEEEAAAPWMRFR
jgi:hypothetical protein